MEQGQAQACVPGTDAEKPSQGLIVTASPGEELKVTSNLKGGFVLSRYLLCMKEQAAGLRIHNLRHPETKGVGQI